MNSLLKALLVEVMTTGSTQVHRRKLALFLNATNMTAARWSEVLDEWVDLGNVRNDLHYLEWGELFTLIAKPTQRVA